MLKRRNLVVGVTRKMVSDIKELIEKAWTSTIDDFKEASDYKKARESLGDRLWNERTLSHHFFYHLKQNATLLSALVEPKLRIGKAVEPDLLAVIELDNAVKWCVFEFKFYENETIIKGEWERIQKYGAAGFDCGYLMAITYAEVKEIPREVQIIDGYEVAAFIHKGPELRVAPEFDVSARILRRILKKVPVHMSIKGWARTEMKDYSIIIGSEDPPKYYLSLGFRFESGTREAAEIERKLRQSGFDKWLNEKGEIVNTYTQMAFLGEFELEPERSIYLTSGYRKIKNCLNHLKPILEGLEPPLM